MLLFVILLIYSYARLRGNYRAMAINLTEYGTLNTTLSPDCYYFFLCD